jgi:hypothetical protein
VEITLPVAQDTFEVGSLLTDWLGVSTTTLSDGLLAVVALPQTITVAVGDSVGPITGPLDPLVLNFPVEEFQEFSAAGLNLGEFEEAAQDAVINAALVALTVSNTADAPLALDDFTLGVVQIDPGTGLPRRSGGQPDYETDGGGAPILVPVTDVGDTLYSIARASGGVPSVRMDTLMAAALVDRLVDLVLDGTRASIVGAGTVLVGDGSVGTVNTSDSVTVDMELLIGLDFTLPVGGVVVDSSTAREGLDLDSATVDDIIARLDSADALLDVTNATPFGLEAAIEVVGDSVADVFALPAASRLPLDTMVVSAADVDGAGRVTQAARDTAAISLTGDEIGVFLGEYFTAGVRLRLFPPVGGRAAVRAADRVIVRVMATLYVRTGGGP